MNGDWVGSLLKMALRRPKGKEFRDSQESRGLRKGQEVDRGLWLGPGAVREKERNRE